MTTKKTSTLVAVQGYRGASDAPAPDSARASVARYTDDDLAGTEAICRVFGGDSGDDAKPGKVIGCTAGGVRMLRHRGDTPRHARPTKKAIYFAADVWEWLKSQRVDSRNDAVLP